MPTVQVDQARLFKALGRPKMSIEEFENLCFEFGVELDDITSERQMAMKEHATAGESAAAAVVDSLSDRTILKIDVSANRYDLLCEEGLARALRVFLGLIPPPVYRTTAPVEKFYVKPDTHLIRPFIVGAVLRNVTLDQAAYQSFIDLQEKLHQGLCRRRIKVAIGTHDLDTIQGPFTYDAQPPEDIRFIPLNQTRSMDGNELMEFYESDRRLSKFLPIIRDSPVYPVLRDSQGIVLSLPPIINGDHSKISVKTKNVLIECTATEEVKANSVLNYLVAMFSEYTQHPFTVEQVEIIYENGSAITPDLSPRKMHAPVDYINSCIGRGIRLSEQEITQYLLKMGLPATIMEDECEQRTVEVQVPVTRNDVLHACDVMEDVAVAYGINRIPKSVPATNTVAAAFPLNKLSDMLRRELACCGYTEVLPLTLCSHDENFSQLLRVDSGKEAVELANPQTSEYQVVRTSLVPGLLKTIHSNKKAALPLKIFEVGDVVLKDPLAERRARNERRLCVIYCGKNSGFEFVHGVLDRVMQVLNVPLDKRVGYSIHESSHPTYFPDRYAEVNYQGRPIGGFGIIHPEVLVKFDLTFPCSCLEIVIEPFL